MNSGYWKSSASDESADLMRQIHLMIRDGKGDEPEADEYRDRAANLWPKLSPDEQRRIRRLSAELAMLYDSEVPRPKPKLRIDLERENQKRRNARHLKDTPQDRRTKLKKQIMAWYDKRDWEPILDAFRSDPKIMEPAAMAAYRGRAYHHFGDYKTALLFYEFARQRDPSFIGHHTIIMQILGDMGRLTEAKAMAEAVVADPKSSTSLLMIASVTILRTENPNEILTPEALKRAIQICQMALERPASESERISRSMAYSIMATANRDLGHANQAKDLYEKALKESPDNATALLGMGRELYDTDPDKAVKYLIKCVELPRSVPGAHTLLTHYFLNHHRPDLVVQYATEAIKYSTQKNEKATLLAWRAIGTLRSGGSEIDAEKDFSEAMQIAPEIPSVSKNYAVFQEFRAKLRVAEIQRSIALKAAEWQSFSNPIDLFSNANRYEIMFPDAGRRPAQPYAQTRAAAQ